MSSASDYLAAQGTKHAATLDEARPQAVASQRKRGALTVRERIALLADPGSFDEIGQLVESANPEIVAPADGVITGLCDVGGVRTAIIAYDYTVYGGTQGYNGHRKVDRLVEMILQRNCPVVMLMEGAGARVQDIEFFGIQADVARLARMSGKVPIVGLALGRVYAGNANMLGVCDVIIGRRSACMGMSGPPLVQDSMGIKITPEELGSAEVHAQAGVIDILTEDDEEAIALAKAYLALLLDPIGETPAAIEPDLALRDMVPTNPRRAYDARAIVRRLADPDTALELRREFAKNIITSFVRVGGRTIGVVANQSMFKAGIIDAAASDKAARFINICNGFGVPLLFLVDTPGFFIGPDAEREGMIRHSARMVAAVANFGGPVLSIVVRKAYGGGYWVMGSLSQSPLLHVAWPTADFGVMNVGGAASIRAGADEEEQARMQAFFRSMGTPGWHAGRGYLDDIIDPAETRALIARTLKGVPCKPFHSQHIDPW